jgi:hypothetical protein
MARCKFLIGCDLHFIGDRKDSASLIKCSSRTLSTHPVANGQNTILLGYIALQTGKNGTVNYI